MYHAELKFPPIPCNLLTDSSASEIQLNDTGYGKEHFKNGEKISPCSYWFSSIKNRELISWFWSNVPVTKILSKFSYQQSHHDTGGYHIVHSDILRSYAINYMIDLGGEDVWTSWYREKGQPIKRLPKSTDTQSDTGYIDYANLELLDSVKFEKNKWYVIATDVLHDVGKIIGTRRSITISVPLHLEKRTFEILNI